MTTTFTIAFLTCSAVVTGSTVAVAQTPDDAAIRDLQARQADAWNRHDATAYASLFTEDGEVVNVVGWWWKGRSQIQSRLIDAFAFAFRDSRMTIADVQTRYPAPRLAIAHVQWTMSGAKTPPGIPEPRQGTQLQVLKKVGGKWLIYSFQNTNSVPEQPFPKGPPTGSADETAIRAIVQNENDTWNKGDAVGYSKDFATNGTFTNIRGQFFTGYEGFLKQHQVIFDGIFKNTTLQQSVVSLKFVRPDVAVVETTTAVSGVTQPPPGVTLDDKRHLHTRLLQIVAKDNGVWKIVSYHNTDVKPGTPITEP